MVRQAQVIEGDRQYLRRIVDDRHTALAQFFDVVFIEKQAPGLGDIRGAKNRLDLLDVVADPRRTPHIGVAVLVAGVVDFQLFHQHRVQVFPVGQLAPVQLLDGTGLDQARHKVVRRADHVIAGIAGHQLGFQHFVAVVNIVGSLDPCFLGETGQGVVGDIAVPVGNIHTLVGLADHRKRCEHDRKG